MAFLPLSTGDILMLSQQAWKIGRAFTQGRSGAPSEFAEVEREANGLSNALKLTAETLHADDSLLSRAEPETRGAINEILESAGKTLGDLESFVERYQVIRKRQTSGGFVVERSWSDVVLANYKTIKWTTEGGDITELRNMIHVHSNTINLTMQALQSRSLARLERTVIPMAENIASIHSRVNGDLGDKIDDLHRLIMSVASSTPSLIARDRAFVDDEGHDRRRTSNISHLDHGTERSLPPVSTPLLPTGEQVERSADLPKSTPVLGTPGSLKSQTPSRKTARTPSAKDDGRVDSKFEPVSPSRPRDSTGNTQRRTSDLSTAEKSNDRSPIVTASYRRESQTPKRESTTLPSLFGTMSLDEAVGGSSRRADLKDKRAMSYDAPVPPSSRSRLNSYQLEADRSELPPPAMPPSPAEQEPQNAATPSFSASSRYRSESDSTKTHPPRIPRASSDRTGFSTLSPSLATLPAFERALFRNAAILCDVRGKLVEYAQKVPDEPDPRFATEMVEACQVCRICVIRKRENRPHGGTKLATSIWTISEDGALRCQHRLSDYIETVPYCSYFEQEKVSIPPTEDGEISLRFHGENWTDELVKEVKTNWVNYIFASEQDAIAFQSAVFGRQLIGSFRTTKTTVLHDGIMGTFAFEEQFANIEMLRLWEDDGIATPGGEGGILALMHISSSFGEGWAKWWMNCSRQQVRVRHDSMKHAKLKGINIIVVKPGTLVTMSDKVRNLSSAGELQRADTKDTVARAKSAGKKVPVKRVTGVRIEFKTEEERDRFVMTANTVQDRLIPLPDL